MLARQHWQNAPAIPVAWPKKMHPTGRAQKWPHIDIPTNKGKKLNFVFLKLPPILGLVGHVLKYTLSPQKQAVQNSQNFLTHNLVL